MDPEIEAMSKIAEALDELDIQAKTRVLRWAVDKYEVTLTHKARKQGNQGYHDPDSTEDKEGDKKEHETFAEFFSDAGPTSNAEKVLVAGYWHQEVLGEKELASASLNKDLKDLGHGVTRMNDAFSSLMSYKPQLAIQLKKTGSSPQARKKYKITKAGIDRVKEMLGRNNDR